MICQEAGTGTLSGDLTARLVVFHTVIRSHGSPKTGSGDVGPIDRIDPDLAICPAAGTYQRGQAFNIRVPPLELQLEISRRPGLIERLTVIDQALRQR